MKLKQILGSKKELKEIEVVEKKRQQPRFVVTSSSEEEDESSSENESFEVVSHEPEASIQMFTNGELCELDEDALKAFAALKPIKPTFEQLDQCIEQTEGTVFVQVQSKAIAEAVAKHLPL